MAEVPRSAMLAETLQAPAAVARQLAQDHGLLATLGARWREQPPEGVLTLARGSSDHAAQHFAYLAMARLGVLVTSLPPSILTLQRRALARPGLLALAWSQSGQSPDLVEPITGLRGQGAQTLAIVNDSASPLAHAVEWLLPLHAGPEHSVAATKSVIAQLVAGVRLIAAWQGDVALAAALQGLPEALQRALHTPWPEAIEVLTPASGLFVVARGPALAMAHEVALKLKEVCGLHAEAVSTAELRHGPMALVAQGLPVLVLATRGAAQHQALELAAELSGSGQRVLLAAAAGTAAVPGLPACPLALAPHEDLDSITALAGLYPFIETLARARGRDPDRPPGLAKVTLTR
jgi:glutamine---fructose-6-phosphate transaminase (isomerizing)